MLLPAIALAGCGAEDVQEPDLAPEPSVQALGALPDPAGKPYVNYFEQQSGVANESWNYQVWGKGTRSIQIAAKHLVLDAADVHHLLSRFHERDDVRRLDIYAEKLVVKQPIRVPGAEVHIHAEELRFEDVGTTPSVIDTSPRLAASQAVPGANGVDGLRAGDIYVAVKSFHSDGNRLQRFVMNGGAGQKGGAGAHGTTGTSRARFAPNQPSRMACAQSGISGTPISGVQSGSIKFTDPGLTLSELQNNTVNLGLDFPTNGGNASPGGKAGSGGDAGSLHSIGAVDLAQYRVAAPGASAANAGFYFGGAAGTPNPLAVKLATATCQTFVSCPDGTIRTSGICPFGMTTTTITRLIVTGVAKQTILAGANAASPGPDRPSGSAGGAVKEPGDFAWYHPHALAMNMAFAEDAFANEYRDLAAGELEKHDVLLAQLQASADWTTMPVDDQTLFTQDAIRIRSLRNQLISHEDYWGNPQSWVPALSLEANLALYEQEVQWAIKTIFVADWLTDENNALLDKSAALTEARALLTQEISKMQTQFDDALARIPVLKADAQTAGDSLALLEIDLQAMEQRLIARATNNVKDKNKLPFWKKALKVLFVTARVLPVPAVQPALGGVAASLDALLSFDSEQPWTTLAQVPDVVKAFTNSSIDDKAKAAKEAAAKESPETKKKKSELKATIAKVQAFVSPVIEELKKHKQDFKDQEVKKEELDKQIEAELKKLKDEDPKYKEVAEQVKRVTEDRDRLVKSITETTDALEQALAKISEHWLEMSELLPELDGVEANIASQRAQIALGEMREKAFLRLKKYQYLLARAYEYRMLKKYPGDLTLTNLFSEMLTLVRSTGQTGVLQAAEYDALYTLYREDISKIVEDVVAAYSNGSRLYKTTHVIYHLTPAELAQLNAGEAVDLDFWERGAFQLRDEDVRIVKFEVTNLDVTKNVIPPGTGDFAFVDLQTKHEGTSRIWRDGKVSVFKHYNKQTLQPLSWTTRWQDGTVSQHQLSESSSSLLRALLPNASTDIMLFSRPAAWAKLSMRQIPHGEGVQFQINAATVDLTYDYTESNTLQNWAQYRDAQNTTINTAYNSLLTRTASADEVYLSRTLLDVGYSTVELQDIVSQSHPQEYFGVKVANTYGLLYQRAPTEDERDFWAKELMDGRPEDQVTSYISVITDTIAEVFGRPPTYDELELYTGLLDDGVPL